MTLTHKQRILGGAAVGASALALTLTIGMASAQTPAATATATRTAQGTPGPNATPGSGRLALANDFLDKLAGKLGITRDRLDTAIKDTQKDQVREALAAGRITQEQADRMLKAIDEGRHPGPLSGAGPGGPGRRGQPGQPGQPGAPGRPAPVVRAGTNVVQVAAQVTGLSEDEITRQLREGKSLVEIAATRGKTQAELKTAVLADARAKLDQQVATGRITREQADQAYARIEREIDGILTAKRAALAPRGTPTARPQTASATGTTI